MRWRGNLGSSVEQITDQIRSAMISTSLFSYMLPYVIAHCKCNFRLVTNKLWEDIKSSSDCIYII